ncbi:MAG TPA: O-antigen ligase family protein [Aggregatilineaceae bacterium]|nr:O-antigen ligase family protein [Aggregatilineaceae bacterium]
MLSRLYQSNRPESRSQTWLTSAVLFALVAVLAVMMGRGIATQNYLFPVFALTLPLGVLALRAPYQGLALALALFFLYPSQQFSSPIPFFDSPLMLLASLLVADGIFKIVLFHETSSRSPVYVPMLMWAGMLILFVVVQHGNRVATSAQGYLQGMWTFAVVILTIKTPRQAAVALIAFYVALIILVVRALPAALSSEALTFEQQVVVQDLRVETGVNFHLPQMAALAWPVLFSLAISSKIPSKLRIMSILLVAAITILIISSGFGTPYITLIAAFVTLVGYQVIFRRTGSIWQTVLIGAVMFFVLFNTGGAVAQLQRIGNPQDASVQGRLDAMGPGLEAFLERPIMGWGDYKPNDAPEGVFVYSGHNSFLEIAVRYGLLGLAPVIFMFGTIGRSIFQLSRKPLRPVDQALVNGTLATSVAYVIQGMISVSIGIITWDTVFWFFIGLNILWLYWIDTGKFETLVEL